MRYVKVELTPMEADAWDWATDPMVEYWNNDNQYDRDDDLFFEEQPIKFAEPKNGGDGSGYIHPHKAIIDDIIYRLGTQLEDISDDELCGNDGKGSSYTKRHMSAMRIKKFAGQVVKKLQALEVEFGI